MTALLLFGVFALLLLIPLLPAFGEWRRREGPQLLDEAPASQRGDAALLLAPLEGRRQLLGGLHANDLLALRLPLRFHEIHAPEICFGYCLPTADLVSSSMPSGTRRLIRGDFRLAAGEVLVDDLVVKGRLILDRGAQLCGSAKVHGAVDVAVGARVGGALIAHGPIRLGRGTWVAGPVLSRQRIVCEGGAAVGALARLTTLSAPELSIAEGCRVFGAVRCERGIAHGRPRGVAQTGLRRLAQAVPK